MNTQTLEQMKQLRLYGMQRAFNSTMQSGNIDYTNDELIAYLLQSEWDDRLNRKIERLTKAARFRYRAVMEDIDYHHERHIDKNLIQRFTTCDFIKNKENILVTGSTGVGKSYMASAIGHQACSLGYKVMYFNTHKLFTKLRTSKADGSYSREINKIETLKSLNMNTQTLEQMKQLRLYGMLRAFDTSLSSQSIDYTNDELIAYLMQSEWDDRQNRKIERLTKTARFRYSALMENIDYSLDRNIDKNQINRFTNCDFVKQKENKLITGSTGAGKSYMASAIGHQACSLGYKVMYFNTTKLFTMLKMSKADGSYVKQINKLEKQDLLILDDFGLKGLDNINRHSFMEIIEDRHGKKSTIIASQLPVEAWHEIIGEQTIADAILDRLVHTAHRINIKGESMRKKQKNK